MGSQYLFRAGCFGALILLASCVHSQGETPPPVVAPSAAVASAPALPEIDRLPDGQAVGGNVRTAAEIDMIVIHSIGGPACWNGEITFGRATGSAVFWRDWFAEQNDKSIHYVVDRDGHIAAQRPELRTAGHVSFAGVMPNVNARSIGIELVNRGDGLEPFPQAQVDALTALVRDIASRYGLGPDAIWAHSELDTRKQAACDDYPRNVDPGSLFPMAELKASLAD